MRNLNSVFCITLMVLAISIKPYEATRMVFGDEEEEHLFLQSLQSRKAVNPPAPSGCSFIPGGGGTPCTASTINEKNFAGRVAVAAPPPPPTNAYPQHTVQFGVATNRKLL
ncbi:hypothetical protein ACH5RR_020257 [Cinchona calisaya]|uniref:Uncharacterized protein n=1 Tax=Cinchona calisaya TaxID=153742 RepID=A0ABD2ZIX2_9GENT